MRLYGRSRGWRDGIRSQRDVGSCGRNRVIVVGEKRGHDGFGGGELAA